MKYLSFFIVYSVAFLGLFISPFFAHHVFAEVSFESFGASIALDQACIPIVTYDVTITPSSIDSANNFVLAVNQVNEQQEIIEGNDYPITIPLNGQVSNATVTAVGFSGMGNFTVRVIEQAPNMSFITQTNPILVASDQGACVVADPDEDIEIIDGTTNPTSFAIEIENPISVNSVPEVILKVLEILIKIGIPLLVVMIVYSGALYLFAMGNPGKIKSAHDMLTYTLIGGAILLGAWAIAQLIYSTLIDLTAFVIPLIV